MLDMKDTTAGVFSRAPAKGAYYPGQGLLLPMRNGGLKQSEARGKRAECKVCFS